MNFHKPETELQANEWLWNYLSRYNAQRHRSEKHSRLEDWLANISQEGVRDMCSWEQYCRFAREPETRKVGVDARITIDGTAWEVEPDMAGETVILLWGCLTTRCMWSLPVKHGGLIILCRARCHYTVTGRSGVVKRLNGPIVSMLWPDS